MTRLLRALRCAARLFFKSLFYKRRSPVAEVARGNVRIAIWFAACGLVIYYPRSRALGAVVMNRTWVTRGLGS